jgi:hypothetical protein
MGGSLNTTTHDVTTKALRSPSSKSKTPGNASEATPTLSCYLVTMLMIVVRCCSTYLAKGTSQTKEQARRYGVTPIRGLVSKELVYLS